MPTALTAQEQKFITGLFARVGFWVSHADDTDYAEDSEQKEFAYMQRALKRVEKLSTSSVISECAGAATSIKTAPDHETEESLTGDLRKAVEILKSHKDEASLSQFRKAILYTGTCVARAYREELDHHEDEFLMENWLNKIIGALNRDVDAENFKNMNISPAEDSAITMISEAIRG